MHSRNDHNNARTLRLVLCLGAVLTVAGCSTPATTGAQRQKQSAKQLQPPRVDIQQDETGFTIMEDVRVSADVRAEYDTGIRLLQQQQYEPGIASLLKVTQAAPNVPEEREL